MLKKVISGGQTGADFAGLRAGRKLRLETGGTAPKGWRITLPDSSEGSNPTLKGYGLTEGKSRAYPPRTRANVRDSDGTVIFGYTESTGAILTMNTAKELNKPLIINPTPEQLREWVATNNIEVLNVAGNRASDFNPTISKDTYNTLVEAFSPAIDKK